MTCLPFASPIRRKMYFFSFSFFPLPSFFSPIDTGKSRAVRLCFQARNVWGEAEHVPKGSPVLCPTEIARTFVQVQSPFDNEKEKEDEEKKKRADKNSPATAFGQGTTVGQRDGYLRETKRAAWTDKERRVGKKKVGKGAALFCTSTAGPPERPHLFFFFL